MAENPARRRSRNPEDEEFAVAVQGAIPERQQRGVPNQWASWRGGNSNRNGPEQTRFQLDSEIIRKLQESRLVHHSELCSFCTSEAIIGQDQHVNAINDLILDIINNMAISRRMLLDFKLRRKANCAEAREHARRLALWPGEVQRLQGKVEGLGGRYLRIPAVLLTPVDLLQL